MAARPPWGTASVASGGHQTGRRAVLRAVWAWNLLAVSGEVRARRSAGEGLCAVPRFVPAGSDISGWPPAGPSVAPDRAPSWSAAPGEGGNVAWLDSVVCEAGPICEAWTCHLWRVTLSLPPLVEPAAELSVDEVRRYSRHLIIPDVGMTGQKRLKNAKVLVRGRGRPRLSCPALPGRGRCRHPGHRRLRRGRRVQPAAADHPRPVRHRPLQGRVGPGQYPRDQPVRERDRARGAPRLGQRDGGLRRLRPDRGRHGQLRHPLPGERRVRAARQALRLGLHLPLRRPGQRVLGRVRPVLPVPVPGAPAARHGAVLRRGRRARRALRVHRLDPGQRGHQGDHRHRRAAGRPADDLRRAGDDVPPGQGQEGPRVPGLRQEPDRSPS